MSDWPGEPWETSMPKIRVGALDTIGMDGKCSTPNREFIPPSYKGIKTFNCWTKDVANDKFQKKLVQK